MAEGGGLLNRYTFVKMYPGFESLRLRHLKRPLDGAFLNGAAAEDENPAVRQFSGAAQRSAGRDQKIATLEAPSKPLAKTGAPK